MLQALFALSATRQAHTSPTINNEAFAINHQKKPIFVAHLFTIVPNDMHIENLLRQHTAQALHDLYQLSIPAESVTVNEPPKQFSGDFSIVIFPYVKLLRKSPAELGNSLAQYLQQHLPLQYEVVQGFVNVTFAPHFWFDQFTHIAQHPHYGTQPANGQTVLVEYCSPNTNKALHLGHVRNMLLGYATAQILQAAGNQVRSVCIYNDRGIAICKSMVAWQQLSGGETPADAQLKGDRLVDKYYVLFGDMLKQQLHTAAQQHPDINDPKALEKLTPAMQAAEQMLQQWEANDPQVLHLWQTMNDWVYDGFEQTYQRMGVAFDKNYYESQTYLLGKQLIERGLHSGVFEKHTDGSVQIDLTDVGLDHKVLLRSNGTAVYLTQDLGTAMLRYDDFAMDKMIYVVATEQDYHFKVLFECLKRLGANFADRLYHLSYGMVELPDGKMKSREGTTVFADDLIDQMVREAAEQTLQLNKTHHFTEQQAQQLYETLGLGALKFFILRVHPKRTIIFNPKESIDLHGFTAPFVQYTHARIQSMLRKAAVTNANELNYTPPTQLVAEEQELIVQLYKYATAIAEAAAAYDPSVIANYVYNLAKTFNKFYDKCSVLNAEHADTRYFRLHLSHTTARTIQSGLALLGIGAPNQM